MSSSSNKLIREGTTVDDLLEILSAEIISGRYSPGTKLDATMLAERFGVSRTPIREMLSQLCALGLGEKRPNRGVAVAQITDTYLEGMFETMAEIEASCARLSALRMTLQERESLKKLHEQSLKAARDGTRENYEQYNHEFHSKIYEGCHNPYLRDLATTTRSRLQPFRKAQFMVANRPSNSWEEHSAIIEAILSGDSDAAAQATRNHVLKVRISTQTFVDEHRPASSSLTKN